jgi:phage terminase small subunit
MTPKQLAFVREYMIDRNATQAAIRAGYSTKTADVQGPRLLGDVRVKKAIAEHEAAHAERCQVTVDSLTREYEEARALALANAQSAAAVSATTGKAKLHGLLDEKPVNNATAVNFVTVYE